MAAVSVVFIGRIPLAGWRLMDANRSSHWQMVEHRFEYAAESNDASIDCQCLHWDSSNDKQLLTAPGFTHIK